MCGSSMEKMTPELVLERWISRVGGIGEHSEEREEKHEMQETI